MQKNMFRKGLALGIIILFVGACVTPSISGNVRKASNVLDMDVIITTGEQDNLLGDPPDEEWNKTFGGTSSDYGRSVQQTVDDGYIITGDTNSYGTGTRDVWLIKTNSNGSEEWNITYGGNNLDEGRSVQQTTDGGYIIAGNTWSYSGDDGTADIWLIKTDSNGNETWNRTFGGFDPDLSHSVQQTLDGGYIITGLTYSYSAGYEDVWLVKADSNGSEEWNKTFGGTSRDRGRSVQQTTNGGYVITGSTRSYGSGSSEMWLIKTDSNGSEEWNNTFGGIDWDEGWSGHQTIDGGYIITGATESYGTGWSDFWLIKTDPNGSEEWNNTFGGTLDEEGHSVYQTWDGGYVITGETESYGDQDYVLLIKTDSNGSEEWNKTFGGIGRDIGHSVQQTTDGGYIITGWTMSYGAGGSDVWLIKLYPNITPSIVYVDDDYNESTSGWGYDHFDSIQDGVDAVNESGKVYVYNGTYFENVVVDKTIDLIGEDRDNTIIDSAEYADVVYISISTDWVNISGFTIRNAEYNCNGIGVRSNFNSIFGNNIVSNNYYGIHLYESNNNIIKDNNISLNYDEGIYLDYSSNQNTIFGNKISKNGWGIGLDGSSSNNFIYENNIFSNDESGIYFYESCNNNLISGNKIITNNGWGIYLPSSSNNTISNNNISDNGDGVYLDESCNNNITDNNIRNNTVGIELDYLANNNFISSNTILDNGWGIALWFSSYNNTVSSNIINSNSEWGIKFYYSSNNAIYGNYISNNGYGIEIGNSSINNVFYHNNFINNSLNAYDECVNTWNNGYSSGGNYWSDYTGDDIYGGPNQDILGSDGIGDTPYNISGGDNQDMYPCMEPNGWINSPPNIPDRPSGEIIILAGVEHTYTTSTIDPDSDSIWFKWDWGDGTYTDWLGPYDSGEEASATASWSQGTYQIRVKAKDNRNPETEWSESLTVNIIYPNFETVFLLGQIGNLNESSELSSFNAVKLLWINFNPIFPQILTSNESIVISNKYFGILLPSFIFGFFNAMILT